MDISASPIEILYSIQVKPCSLDLDAAYIVFAFQSILPKPEDPGWDVVNFIGNAIVMKNQKLISIKMQGNVLLPAKKAIDGKITEQDYAKHDQNRNDFANEETYDDAPENTEEEENACVVKSTPPLIGSCSKLTEIFHRKPRAI